MDAEILRQRKTRHPNRENEGDSKYVAQLASSTTIVRDIRHNALHKNASQTSSGSRNQTLPQIRKLLVIFDRIADSAFRFAFGHQQGVRSRSLMCAEKTVTRYLTTL